jgi:signal transduction histidine kinase
MSVIACDIPSGQCSVIAQHAISVMSGGPAPGGIPGELARLFDATNHVVWSTSSEGDLTYCSSGWNKLFGLAAVGEPVVPRIVGRLHAGDQQKWQDQWLAALDSGQAYEVEYRLEGAHSRWYVERGMPVFFTSGGPPDAWLMTATPVDRHKRCEQALRNMVHRRDDFFATLLHELRNPLAPIANAVESLAMDITDHSRVVAMRGIIERQLNQLTHLVDDLLDVSRIAHGAIELQLRTVDLAEIMAVAVEAARPTIELHNHELIVMTPPEPIAVQVDRVRMTQVLTNLLINAAKYTNPGGHIVLSAEREGRSVALHVSDDGIGIPPEKLVEVFELFSRAAPRAPVGGTGGLGVGLAVCRQLVELHGGSICAHSDGPGCGSDFVVRLPAQSADCRAAAPQSKSTPSTL